MALLLAICLFASAALATEELFSDDQKQLWPIADQMKVEKRGGEMLEALLDREENKCYGKKCSHSEECCKGAACVDIEGLSGTCLPIHGKEFYQPCEKDSDCGAGLVCIDSGNFAPSKTCQLEGRSIQKKGFNDECVTSSDCDTDRGLCCQVLRRHRMAAKKLCHYFLDPKSCVGEFHTTLQELKYVPNPFFKARLG
ncbi:prohormone-3 [Nephila pilipes]|uniref:Prohormone-3 n=1 Tax=Nephila pilipes TaxID=299642 RepID=A0A8X6PQ60_NEPPI|nr:prohormone-3 [Nephila pilipes]